MTGIPHFNFPAFDMARTQYKQRGYVVFNPADNDRGLLNKPADWVPQEEDSTPGWESWITPGAPDLRTMLGQDLEWIAKNATHIHMLKGWENSRGAQAEWALARALDLTISYE